MAKRTKAQIYKAMTMGNKYTNAEAKEMRDHFKLTADVCHLLGDRFHLAFKEANEQYLYLCDVCRARGLAEAIVNS